jgi:tetratricopeptide (TPR) repeat protein
MNDQAAPVKHATTSDHQVVLDPENPWLGLFSYTEATRAFFHGRDEETAELARRVQNKILTVLFGQSGLGKTSLLRAGLVPRLRKEGYCPVYVRIDYAAGSPVPSLQIRQAIFRVTTEAGHWTRPGSSADGESLWELLHHRGDFLRDADGHPLTPLLIFDQFEEIFTLGQADDAGKARARQFLEDLADLVENRAPTALEARMDEDDNAAEDFDFGRADYRVLITLREDYLAYLESIKGTMPSITQNRMRLARMNGEQALDAVVKPGGKLVTQEVAEAIVRFVAGGAELKNAEIEPSLLSLVCRELNTIRQTQKRKEISTDLLAGSRETILSEFYERALADQPERVRRVIEDELLTESGYRESVAEERVLKSLAAAGAAPETLATLVNRRLLRIEERLDMRRVELTHDVLCGVVVASRNARHEREARDAAEQQLAAQREREIATHRALRRARRIATVSVTLLVLALASATFGFYNLHRARTAETQAQAARTNAEGLVSFLIEDFYTALEPTGKLKTLGTLAQKTVDYYNTLPPGQVTQQTRINRAMALTRLGSIQLQGGHHDTAEKSFTDARATFDKLRAAGDHSEPVTYGLALIGTAEGWDALNTGSGNTQPLLQAVDLLRPLAKGPHPTNRVLQLYGYDLNGVCTLSAAAADTTGKGLPACDESLAVLEGLGALNLKDLTAAASWANTAYSKASILTTLNRLPEAQGLAQQAYTLTEKVLAKRPDDMGSLDNRTLVASLLATLASRQYDDAKAAEWADKSIEAAREKVRFDPSNLTAWLNWAYALDSAGQFQFNRGEVARAIATRRAAVALADDPRAPKRLGPANAILWQHLMLYQAMTGDRAGAEQSMEPYLRGYRASFAKLPPDSPQRRLSEVDELFARSVINVYLGAPQQAFQQASAAIAKIEAVKVPAADAVAVGTQKNTLDINQRIAMRAAVQLGRYADAEKLAHDWLQVAAPFNPTDPSPEAGKAQVRITLAQAIAMQGRKDEARKALQPSLDYYGEQFKAGATSTNFRTNYANALYASAISQSSDAAGAKQRKADLDAAQAQIDGASKEAQQLTTMRHTASLIAAARTGHER